MRLAASIIRARIPRLRRDGWEWEELDYGYSNGTLYVETPPESRVGEFATLDDALAFLVGDQMRGTIVSVSK